MSSMLLIHKGDSLTQPRTFLARKENDSVPTIKVCDRLFYVKNVRSIRDSNHRLADRFTGGCQSELPRAIRARTIIMR